MGAPAELHITTKSRGSNYYFRKTISLLKRSQYFPRAVLPMSPPSPPAKFHLTNSNAFCHLLKYPDPLSHSLSSYLTFYCLAAQASASPKGHISLTFYCSRALSAFDGSDFVCTHWTHLIATRQEYLSTKSRQLSHFMGSYYEWCISQLMEWWIHEFSRIYNTLNHNILVLSAHLSYASKVLVLGKKHLVVCSIYKISQRLLVEC